MKRRNLFITLFTIMIISAICILSQTAVFADWEPFYQQSSGYATRVTKTYNGSGQTVYTAYNSWGGIVLDIRARGGNIWNETSQVLYTSTNRGAEYVGIEASLDVDGINCDSNPMMYRNGFQSGEIPYVDRSIQASSIMTDNNGVAIGVYGTNGSLYYYQSMSNSNGNCNLNSGNYEYGYPRVVQNNNESYYYDNPNTYYNYKLTSNKLSYKAPNGTTASMSAVSEIGFGQGYLATVTTSNKVNVIDIGTRLVIRDSYDYYFEEWIYQSSNSYWVVGYRDNYGNNHYFENYNYNNDYDYDDNYDYYGEYPRFYQNGTNEYVYCSSPSKTYKFYLNNNGLIYNNTTIEYNVEQVEFADGYMVYVDDDLDVYKVRVGSTSKTKVCSNFREFHYDEYTGMVYEAIDRYGRSYGF